MARLSPEQIYAVALQAGFPPDRAVTFTAIALAESAGDPSANAAGSEDSRGLWQINVSPGVRPNSWGDLYDPLINARAALEVSNGGTNIQPWSVTHAQHAGTSRDYRQYLPEAQAAAAAVGADPEALAVPSAVAGQAGGADPSGVETFVQAALAQVGDTYVFGHDVDLDDPDPATWDCSELTQWAAHQAGVELGEATYIQYLDLRERGATMDVEQALQTRGALLFYFSSEPTPGGGRPAGAHVAISLGDGRVVEAANPGDGVVVSEAGNRFNYAATVPGLTGGAVAPQTQLVTAPATVADPTDTDPTDTDPTDTDSDGLTDEFEAMLGTDAALVDTDEDDLTDLYETTVSHTDALKADTDDDGISDALEVADGTDAGVFRLPDEIVAAGFGGAGTADIDRDGLSDLLEHQLGTDRDAVDSDLDGVGDAEEYALGSDLLSIDTDLDGVTDGVEMDMGTLGPAAPATLPPGTLGTAPEGLGTPADPAIPAPASPLDAVGADPSVL